MGKQSRLRTKREQGRRPAILFLILLCAALAGTWYFIDFHKLFQKIGEFFDVAEKSMDAGSDTRGIIYDRNFKELAVSLEKVSVVARMREISSLAETAAQLSSVLRIDSQQILDRLRDDSPRTWVVQNISQQQEEAVRRLNIPGISLTEEKARFYPQEETAAHLIGFAENDIGLSGIEYYYDSLLSRHSTVKEENDAPIRGFPHLVLTIDLKIQLILENLVATLVDRQPDARAGAYLMDAGSGAIVASVQHPSYNPNNYREYPAQVLTNMFLEPLLLPDGIRRLLRDASLLNTHYEANGSQLPWSLIARDESLGSQVRLYDRIGLNEPIPPEFIEDSQTLTAKGGRRMVAAGQREAFDTIPESLTPLQLMTAVTCLINSGEKVRAKAVSQLVDPESKKGYPLPGREEQPTGQQTVAAQTSREILRLLAAQSHKGNLDSLFFEEENLVASESGNLWNLRNHRLLLSVVPSLHPELVLLVVLETPAVQARGRKSEQQDLAAAVDGVIQRISALQQVSTTVSDVVSPAERRPKNFTAANEGSDQDARIRVGALDREERAFTMPDLKGMSLRKALREMRLAEARIRIVGTGKVTSQDPKPGEVVAKNGEVVIFLQKEEAIQVKRLEKRESMLESHQ